MIPHVAQADASIRVLQQRSGCSEHVSYRDLNKFGSRLFGTGVTS